MKKDFESGVRGRMAKDRGSAVIMNRAATQKEAIAIATRVGDSMGTVQQNKYSNLKDSATSILAEAAYKPENQMTAREKMNIIREGISKKDLERLKETAKLDYDKLAKLLSVTRATLINKKKEEKFNTALSERILALADIYSYGYEVFEDEVRFNNWMFRPNHALGGQAPFDLVDNQFGREEVRNIIGRIDYGVYS